MDSNQTIFLTLIEFEKNVKILTSNSYTMKIYLMRWCSGDTEGRVSYGPGASVSSKIIQPSISIFFRMKARRIKTFLFSQKRKIYNKLKVSLDGVS